MTDIEVSQRCVFIAHCMLAQTVRAEGCAKAPAAIKRVIEFLMEHEINIMQMPCPESIMLGIAREKHGKKWYEEKGFREVCRDIARNQVNYMKALEIDGKKIVGVIGVTFSPACSFERDNGSVYRQEGIYGEELRAAMKHFNIDAKMISVNPDWKDKLEADLLSLLE